MTENEATEGIIGSAIEVHRTLGPGLLESVYEECLAVELGSERIAVRTATSGSASIQGTAVGGGSED